MIAMNGDVVAFLRLTFAMVLASAWAEIGLLDGVRGFEKGSARRFRCFDESVGYAALRPLQRSSRRPFRTVAAQQRRNPSRIRPRSRHVP